MQAHPIALNESLQAPLPVAPERSRQRDARRLLAEALKWTQSSYFGETSLVARRARRPLGAMFIPRLSCYQQTLLESPMALLAIRDGK